MINISRTLFLLINGHKHDIRKPKKTEWFGLRRVLWNYLFKISHKKMMKDIKSKRVAR